MRAGIGRLETSRRALRRETGRRDSNSVADPIEVVAIDDPYSVPATAGTEPLAELPEALAADVTETTRVLLGSTTTHRGESDTDDQTVREGDDG